MIKRIQKIYNSLKHHWRIKKLPLCWVWRAFDKQVPKSLQWIVGQQSVLDDRNINLASINAHDDERFFQITPQHLLYDNRGLSLYGINIRVSSRLLELSGESRMDREIVLETKKSKKGTSLTTKQERANLD